MLQELHGVPPPLQNGVASHSLAVPQDALSQNDLTPNVTPTSSPTIHRKRIISISNPEPVIKLVAEGLGQKVEALISYLNDKLLLSVLEDSDDLLKTTSRGMYCYKPHHELCMRCSGMSIALLHNINCV